MRYAVLAAAALCSLPVLTQATEKRDWHIGCEPSGKCSYYEGDKVEHGHLAPRQPSPAPDSADVDAPIPDYMWFDTRCKPGSALPNIIERSNGVRWVDIYTCPYERSCVDLKGHGACWKAPFTWVVPGRRLLTVFKCDGNGIKGICVETGETMPLNATWGGPGPHRHHNPRSTPKRMYDAPTRCRPGTLSEAEYYDEETHSWMKFHTCGQFGKDEVCRVEQGRAACWDGAGVHVIYPALSLPEDKRTALGQRKRDYQAPTRCNPTSPMVQYYDDRVQSWINFHECQGTEQCVVETGISGCADGNGVVYPSIFLPGNGPDPDASDDSDDDSPVIDIPKIVSSDIQTRCDPADDTEKLVQYLDGNDWEWFYSCRNTCIQLPEFAACHEGEDRYLVPAPETPARTLRVRAKLGTRCNPRSASEVQRFNGKHWVLSYTCAEMESCRDIDGHGYCHPQFPAHVATKCSAQNESEIVEWNGKSWDFSGVCLPPYVCEAVAPNVDFAVCKHPDNKRTDIWLPWPSLSSKSSSGVITRCSGSDELTQFDGENWVPYRKCNAGFSCRLMKDARGASNGGCVAKDFQAIRLAPTAHNRRTLAAPEDPDHYEPFGFDHDGEMLQYMDPGLIENTEKLLFEGEGLIQEGKDLVDHGDALYESLYGSGSVPAQPDEGAASPNSESTSKSRSASTLHRRNEQGLVDDSADMRRQGQRLVDEGNALVEQGRKLLATILGDETDQVVRDMTDSEITATPTASAPKETGAALKPRGLDAPCRRACDCGAFPSRCDKECRNCLKSEIGGTAAGESLDDIQNTHGPHRHSRRDIDCDECKGSLGDPDCWKCIIDDDRSLRRLSPSCKQCLECGLDDADCWEDCLHCVDDLPPRGVANSRPTVEARYRCSRSCRKCYDEGVKELCEPCSDCVWSELSGPDKPGDLYMPGMPYPVDPYPYPPRQGEQPFGPNRFSHPSPKPTRPAH
ncbi:hypothetical protein K458DRAFT_471398 [Lentithecium fluviatile CBS 122367]|uniref:Uncharacterized protein n=1 Tax=Lentithecium fluviatile CBS 122367 TaxID=1168545 RepID=A0A6G1J6I5_9PLEO|nr:hypothetical protein K458DRAFT_471398 [Lentithecium fluviatile CBS 122367]